MVTVCFNFIRNCLGWIGSLGLIDANYCLCNGLAMRSCCVVLGTMSGHLWWSMIMWEKRKHTCMCNWVTTLYSRKLTEHCKPAIMEKIKIIIKKNFKPRKISKIVQWMCPLSRHLWWSMIMWEKRMYTCMCDWVTLLYSRKVTEH